MYGKGEPVEAFVSAAGEAVAHRLVVQDLADLGHAPGDLIDHGYTLNYGGRVGSLTFLNGNFGVAKDQEGSARGFSYTYKKTAPDEAELALEYQDGSLENFVLDFWQGRVGNFHSSIPRDGRRPRKQAGTFRTGYDIGAENASPPQALAGSNFVFRDRGMVTEIEFGEEGTGKLTRLGKSQDITYTYNASEEEASVEVSIPGSGETHDYAMSFDARNSGIFVCRIISGNRVRDIDRGQFSGRGADDDDKDGAEDGGDTEETCLAPNSLEGMTLKVTIDDVETTILLSGANTGGVVKTLRNGRVTLVPFTYSYTKEGNKQGNLEIEFKRADGGVLKHVFKLDFTSLGGGSVDRDRYEDDDLDDTQSGTFSLEDEEGEERGADRGRDAGEDDDNDAGGHNDG